MIKALPKVLLVERDKSDFEITRNLLQKCSFKHDLLHAETLYESFEILKRNKVEIVLIELNLPDSTGFKTLTAFLDKHPSLPTIIVSSISNENVAEQAIKTGAQDFLVKQQFSSKILGRTISNAILRNKKNLQLKNTAHQLEIKEKRFLEAQNLGNFANYEMDIVSQGMRWSDEMFKIFGLQPRSFAPQLTDYLAKVHYEDKKIVEQFFEEVAKNTEDKFIEHRIVIDAKAIKDIKLIGKVQYDELLQKVVVIGIIQDISKVGASSQNSTSKNVDNKASQIQEETIADIGFHIRTPLSSIVNLVYVLEDQIKDQNHKSTIQGLRSSADDLSLMVNNLMNVVLLSSGDLDVQEEPFKLRDFLMANNSVLKFRANNHSKKLYLNFSDQIPQNVYSDPQKFTLLFYNLLDMGIKDPHVEEIEGFFDYKVDTRLITIEVNEFGKAFTKSELVEFDKVLETSKLQFKSIIHSNDKLTTLGIVKKLVTVLGGTIEVKSKAKGNTFRISFPIETIAIKTGIENNAIDQPLKVLLVEDHFLNQIANKKLLTNWNKNISVDIAENGLIAVEKFRAHHYDLVLMDLQMPVMDGIEASKKIRDISQVPIIAISANTSSNEKKICKNIGVNSYLTKPFNPDDLYQMISALMADVATPM